MVEVGRALRRGDDHEIPEVAAAAREMRARILDPLKDRAEALGLLPEDVEVETAQSYFTRVWEVEQIQARGPEFRRRLTDYFQGGMEETRRLAALFADDIEALRTRHYELNREILDLEEAKRGWKEPLQGMIGVRGANRLIRDEIKRKFRGRIWELNIRLRKARKEKKAAWQELRTKMREASSQPYLQDYDIDELLQIEPEQIPAYAEEAARAVFNTITDPTFELRQMGGGAFKVPKTQGPLRERTLHVRDLDFEEFLVSDATEVLERYTRQMVAETELTERFGDADMLNQIEEIRFDYEVLAAAAPDDQARLALSREMRRTLDGIEAVRNFLRGNRQGFDHPWRSVREIERNVLSFNYVAILGNVTVSSVMDPIRVWQVHGARRFFGATAERWYARLRGDDSLRRITAEDAGVAEMLTNARIAQMVDLDDPYRRTLGVTRFNDKMSRAASYASGITWWNQTGKEFALHTFIGRMHDMTQRDWSGLSAADQRYLSTLKISPAMFDRIGAQLQRHGRKANFIRDPRTVEWTDEVARDLFRDAMRAEADSLVVTPGLGDKPLWAQFTGAKLFFQFKSFWFGAHQRAFMRGMQEDQLRYWSGAGAMIGVGMLVALYKYYSSGRTPPDNFGTLIADGVDRSGIIPMYMEFNNMAESMGVPGVFSAGSALGAAFGEDPTEAKASRFFNRGAAGAVLGPTAGQVDALNTIARDTLAGDWKRRTVGAVKKLTPFHNLPGVRETMNLYAVPAATELVE